jgi:hypothetical protein
MSSSAGVGFIPPKATDYAQQDGSWIGRLNYITLVENALSGPQDKDFKDTCTCTGLYVATVRARANRARRIDRDEDDDNEEHEHEDEDEDEEYAMAHIQVIEYIVLTSLIYSLAYAIVDYTYLPVDYTYLPILCCKASACGLGTNKTLLTIG